MDQYSGRKNVSDLAVAITFLAPFLVYAFIEYLICCLWNLVLRSLHGLCCLLLHGLQKHFEGEEWTKQELAENSLPDKAQLICQLHQETTSSCQQNKRRSEGEISRLEESTDCFDGKDFNSLVKSIDYVVDKEFYRSEESTDYPGYFKKTSECQGTLPVEGRGKNKDKQSVEKVVQENEISCMQRPGLARKQRITKYNIYDTKPDDDILHQSSTASYRINCSNNETESDVHDSHAIISKANSNDQRFPCTRKENEQESGKRKIFDDNFLNESKTGTNREVLSEKMTETKYETSNRGKGNAEASIRLDNPRHGKSNKPEEKSHLTAVIATADNETQMPRMTMHAVNQSNSKGLFEEGKKDHELGAQQQLAKTTTTTTDSPQGENYKWVTNSFQTEVTSGFKKEERLQLDVKGFCCNFVNCKSHPNDSETKRVSSLVRVTNIAQTRYASSSDSTTTAAASEEGVTERDFLTSSLITSPLLSQQENETFALPSNVDGSCPNPNFVSINPTRETPKKCKAPYMFETKTKDQNSVTATNSRRPNQRKEQVKRSRIPFPRVSQRLALKCRKATWL